MDAPELQRLKNVGMNCGCEYTSFPRFAGLGPYSRFTHSVGAALIVRHFTGDAKQTLAGLLHDIATPVFAHVVDFLRGDYLTQETTESGTEAIIAHSETVQACLASLGLTTADVCDYHRYPIADNDSPRLSADRLEYTLGNCLNYGIRTAAEIRAFYDDLTVAVNEEGTEELAFRTAATADDFTAAALTCSGIYVSDEDRYAMQMLAEVLRLALDRGAIGESDLRTTEPEVIRKLKADAETAAAWERFRAYRRIARADRADAHGEWRRIAAKKRYIDPLIAGSGRVSACIPARGAQIAAFLSEPQDAWLCGMPE